MQWLFHLLVFLEGGVEGFFWWRVELVFLGVAEAVILWWLIFFGCLLLWWVVPHKAILFLILEGLFYDGCCEAIFLLNETVILVVEAVLVLILLIG